MEAVADLRADNAAGGDSGVFHCAAYTAAAAAEHWEQ